MLKGRGLWNEPEPAEEEAEETAAAPEPGTPVQPR